jgi:RHH-type rel operon transcriptional repressor/antitoxin RelB
MKTGRTKAFYLRRLIEENLDVLEDAYLGQAAWEAFQASGARAIPLDSLKRDLGLED